MMAAEAHTAHRAAVQVSASDRRIIYDRARRAAVRHGLTAAAWSAHRAARGRQLRDDLMMAADPAGEVARVRAAASQAGG